MNIQSVPRRPGRRKAKERLLPQVPAVTEAAALAASPPPGRLFIEPEELRAKADLLGAQLPELAGIQVAVRGGPSAAPDEEQVVLQVDPLAAQIGAYVRSEVLRYGEVVTASQVDPAAHGELCAQVDAAAGAYVNCKQRAQDIEDSLRVMGQSNRQLRDEIKAGVALALEVLPEAERVALRSAYARIEAEEARLARQAEERREEAQADNQRGAAVVGQARRRERLLETMIDLRQGTPVPPGRAEEAAAAFAEARAEAPARPEPPGRRGGRRTRRG